MKRQSWQIVVMAAALVQLNLCLAKAKLADEKK